MTECPKGGPVRPARNAKPRPRSPEPWPASGCASSDQSPPAPTDEGNPTAPATPIHHAFTAPTSNEPATSTARPSTPSSASSSSPTTSSCSTTHDAYETCSKNLKRSPSKPSALTATRSVELIPSHHLERPQPRLYGSRTQIKRRRVRKQSNPSLAEEQWGDYRAQFGNARGLRALLSELERISRDLRTKRPLTSIFLLTHPTRRQSAPADRCKSPQCVNFSEPQPDRLTLEPQACRPRPMTTAPKSDFRATVRVRERSPVQPGNTAGTGGSPDRAARCDKVCLCCSSGQAFSA